MSHISIQIAKTLRLKKPFVIQLDSRKSKDTAGLWWPEYSEKGILKIHKIRIYISDLEADIRNLDTLIAHELIHAKQEEMGYTDTHGKSFKRYAKKLAELYGLPNIYLKEYDT